MATSGTDSAVEEFAPAKINLALHVTGRRADGYHLLESLVVFARDLGDTVSAVSAPEWRLDVAGPFAAALAGTTAGDNLITRAARALATGRTVPPCALTVTKHIPVAAGLGGGSADAAATLRLINRRESFGLGPEALAAIARPLGADVPMCIHSRPLIARGIGERIEAGARMPELALVLVCPPVAVRTADVFGAVGALGGPLPPVPAFSSVGDVCAWLRRTRNDLAEPAARVAPEAAAAATLLARDPRCLFARMTGSGPTAFGIFPSRAIADQVAAEMAAARPGWWVQSTTTGGS